MTALVVIPTYNERDNIPPLVERLLRHGDVRVLVVDDNSPDGTGGVADALVSERVAVLHRSANRGFGRSYLDGIAYALGTPADVICQMDADFSHDPDRLPDLIAATQGADLAIGSRYVEGGGIVNWPARRRALSQFANAYVRALTGLRAHDCTSGYRCWRREALATLPLNRFVSDGYSFLVEMLYAAARQGRRIAEVPISYVERREGQSKMSRTVILESAVTPWRLIATQGRVR